MNDVDPAAGGSCAAVEAMTPPRPRRACAAMRGGATLPRAAGRGAPPALIRLAILTGAASIAVLVAAPWLDERLGVLAVIGTAAALLAVPQLRGWSGECLTLATAAAALAVAFHWTPEALATALAGDRAVGCAIAAPIILWDAVRLALPFWFASRTVSDPRSAWLPAGLAACAVEAAAPAVFPWKLGYAQLAWPVVIQSADLCGAEATTFTFFAHAGALACLATRATAFARGRVPTRSWIGRLALVVCVANATYGVWAAARWRARIAAAPRLVVALVQADPDAESGLDVLRTLARQARSTADGPPDLVCWPESSGGCYAAALDSLADPERVLSLSRPPQAGLRPLAHPPCPLLFGGRCYRGHPDKPSAVHQSAYLIDGTEAIVGRTDKRHLMPFGEYVPAAEWFPDLARRFAMQEEITAGEPRTLPLVGVARLGVLLCYEDMVPAAARRLVLDSATVLVSLVNAAAFPRPVTLVQHRLLAQLRAVECRRSLLRCATTGETCLITPIGEVAERLPLRTRGALVVSVPLIEGRTLAVALGPAFPGGCAVVAAALAWAARRRRGPAVGSSRCRLEPAP